jgi:hypothetical protein
MFAAYQLMKFRLDERTVAFEQACFGTAIWTIDLAKKQASAFDGDRFPQLIDYQIFLAIWVHRT